MNTVGIVGRICHELKTETLPDEKILLRFRIACRNSRRKAIDGKPTTDFFTIVAFNALASHVAVNCEMSQKIFIKGMIQNSISGVEVIAEEVEFLEKHIPKGELNTPVFEAMKTAVETSGATKIKTKRNVKKNG